MHPRKIETMRPKEEKVILPLSRLTLAFPSKLNWSKLDFFCS